MHMPKNTFSGVNMVLGTGVLVEGFFPGRPTSKSHSIKNPRQ